MFSVYQLHVFQIIVQKWMNRSAMLSPHFYLETILHRFAEHSITLLIPSFLLSFIYLPFPYLNFLFLFLFLTEESPYPFNREGKFLYKASDWKAVPRSFPGDPPEIALIGR